MRLQLAVLAFLAVGVCAAERAPLPAMSKEAWRSDLAVFARELPKRHMNAFHTTTREEFARAVAALDAKIPNANDDEIVAGFLQLGAMIGDGHTHVELPANVHRLPIGIVQFGDDYRITLANEQSQPLLGGKLVRIDDTSIADAVTRVRSVIPRAESEWFVRGNIPSWLLYPEVLHGLGIAKDARHVSVTVRDDTGKEVTAQLTPVDVAAKPQWLRAAKQQPLYRQNPEAPFAITFVEPNTVYANFRRYDDLKKNARALFQMLDSKKGARLVIDMRQNGGGDYTDGRAFLVNEVKRRPNVKTYVLVGNHTFSAAMNNAIDLRNAGAMLVGEPIGERPNSYQENNAFALPASKLVVSYSTRFYKFLPDGAPPIVMPDKQIEPTWEDFAAGRDRVLDWVTAH
jgi:hypothetical protein